MGDTLLLEASHQFEEQYRFRRGFLLKNWRTGTVFPIGLIDRVIR